ncbi:MAG: hypothetical protein ABIP51_15215 [Bacteroidia bacterium]
MRYFLISFNIVSTPSIGSINFESETFPSHSLIEEKISIERKLVTKVVIISIFEFKNQFDYNSYNL